MVTEITEKTTTLEKVLNLRNRSREKFNKIKLEYINAVTMLRADKDLAFTNEFDKKLKQLNDEFNVRCTTLDTEYAQGFKTIIEEYKKRTWI